MRKFVGIVFASLLALVSFADWRGAFDDAYFAQAVEPEMQEVLVWTQVAGLPIATATHGCAVLGSNLYCIGGMYSGGYLTNVWKFDGSSWSAATALPASIAFFSTATFGTNIFLMGGQGSLGSYTPYCFRFDGNSWTRIGNMPNGRNYSLAGVLGTNLYCIGGAKPGDDPETGVYFLQTTGTWGTATALPGGNSFAGPIAPTFSNKLYSVSGGGENNPGITNVWRFDGSSWEQTVGVKVGNILGVSITYQDKIYQIAGNVGGTTVTNVYRFDGSQWVEIVGLPLPVQFVAAGVLDDKLYVVGGQYYSGGWVQRTNVFRLDISFEPK